MLPVRALDEREERAGELALACAVFGRLALLLAVGDLALGGVGGGLDDEAVAVAVDVHRHGVVVAVAGLKLDLVVLAEPVVAQAAVRVVLVRALTARVDVLGVVRAVILLPLVLRVVVVPQQRRVSPERRARPDDAARLRPGACQDSRYQSCQIVSALRKDGAPT